MAVGVLDPRKGLIWQDDGSSLTPEQIEQLQALEVRKRMGGVDTSPVNHWSQGAARVVDALGGVLRERRLSNAASENQAYNTGLVNELVGQSSPAASAATSGVNGEMAATSPAPVVAEGEIADYIRQSASARGIDPDIALRVAMSEGGVKDPIRQSGIVKNGVREPSYGPFQLYMGGGLGNKALEAGIDPRDPNQWRQGVDFALDQAATGGWSPWYGAAKVGVGNRAGLDNARAIGFSPQTAPTPAAAAIETVAPTTGYVDPMVSAPNAAPEAAFDGGRFGGPSPVAPLLAGSAPEVYSAQSDFAPELPAPVNVAAAPPVASVPQQMAPQAQPANNAVIAQALRAMADPRANEGTRRVASALLQQEQQKQQYAQEQAVWQQRQEYERQQQANDPYRQLQIQKLQQDVSGGSRQSLVNAGDGRLYDPNTQSWITAPDAASKNFRQATPEEIKVFGTNGQVGPDGKFYPITPPQGTALSVDPNTGAVTFNQGAGVKPLTEGQSKDSFFTTRMTASLPSLEANEQALLSLGGKLGEAVPMNLGNYAQSEEYQLARDAGRDFVTAYLRKDSGAALTPSEEKIYGELLLPQPGDKPATIALKRQRRQVAVEAIKSGMPPQALDGVIKAINSVPGADKPTKPTVIDGYQIEEITE